MKKQTKTYAPSEDSTQPGHRPSQIRAPNRLCLVRKQCWVIINAPWTDDGPLKWRFAGVPILARWVHKRLTYKSSQANISK